MQNVNQRCFSALYSLVNSLKWFELSVPLLEVLSSWRQQHQNTLSPGPTQNTKSKQKNMPTLQIYVISQHAVFGFGHYVYNSSVSKHVMRKGCYSKLRNTSKDPFLSLLKCRHFLFDCFFRSGNILAENRIVLRKLRFQEKYRYESGFH